MPETREEFEYLPVECPRCGTKGRLRIERLDRSFTCKQCKRVFHVGVSKIVAGERPPDPTDEIGSALDPGWIKAAPPSQLQKFWDKLPKDGKTMMGGAIFIGMLVVCNVIYFWFLGGEGVPSKLLDRAKYVGEAYARNDFEALKPLIAPDMEKDATQWLEESRPAAWKDVPADAVIAVSVPLKPDVASAKFGMATVTVKIVIPSVPGYLSMALYWAPQSKNSSNPDWLLDAKRTGNTAGKKRLALTIPPPRKRTPIDDDPG